MVSPASSRLRMRLTALLPILCLIHCVGMALFAAALPAAALWLRSDWLEGGLTFLSSIVIGGALVRRGPERDPEGLSLALFSAAMALCGLGWLYEQEVPRHIGLLLFVATQLVWLRSQRAHRACACPA